MLYSPQSTGKGQHEKLSLAQDNTYQAASVSKKVQIRAAVKLYVKFLYRALTDAEN